MREVAVHDAVGLVLGHDITRIVPGREKGRAFKKGHVIRSEDIPQLLDLGKKHVYVWDPVPDMVHEDEAAPRLAAGPGLVWDEPDQGKVNLKAARDGLLKVRADRLGKINSLEGVALATLHNNRLVAKGKVVAVETAGDQGIRAARVKLTRLSEQADLVLTVGGMASGPDDYALALFKESGARVLFRGVRIKPGHHTGAGLMDDRPVIALSGNPAACAVAYQLLAAPVLRAYQGLKPCPPARSAVCTDAYPKAGGPRRFRRGFAACGQEGWQVSLLPGQKSSMLRSLINCNVLVELPAGHPPLQPGDVVSVIPLSGWSLCRSGFGSRALEETADEVDMSHG